MRRSLAVGALVAALGLGAAAPATAAPLSLEEREEGLWYADILKFDEVHGQGITGEGGRSP